ncbi:S1/P1 nuclease [Flavobacterium agricola]|uniref:S1/P1 nuclease n=1 Tax=Flavobacterium agricola TaxID=2870839 RepID=A0ABY6LWQ4_9FLAO|nr:S1/P1 nuclease [Flavobacterium agricola]UYW00769.1 S1/P1 nuclease [Flavobacterium agricola]
MKVKILLAAVVLTASFTAKSWAWGSTGHRIVTEIAERNLTKKAKKNLKKVIGDQKLAYFANWADFVKSNPDFKEKDSWHYLNIEAGLDKDGCYESIESSSDRNLYKRSLLLIDDLKNNKELTNEEQREALYYLVHMIGDAHQPMHVGRPEDLGGNKITVEYFGQRTNIHSVWDSKLIDSEQYSYTEYSDILNNLTKEQIKEVQEGELKDWLYDAYLKATDIYNEVDNNRTLRYEYQYNNKYKLEEQLQKGGLRLAKILNEIYG